MEEIIKELKEVIAYFDKSFNCFQEGRKYQAEVTLKLIESRPLQAGVMKKNAEGLLPCPFCRGDATVEGQGELIGNRWTTRAVTCKDCECWTDEYPTATEAIASWNKAFLLYNECGR